MIPGAVHRSPDLYLTSEENPAKPSMKAVRTVIASIGVPSLPMSSVESHSTSGKEKEGKKQRWSCLKYPMFMESYLAFPITMIDANYFQSQRNLGLPKNKK